MTEVPVYGGPLKRDLIQMAYEECGQAGYEFELEPEEYAYALRRLDALMAQWQARGIDLGYAFPDTGPASAQEESGIPYSAADTVATGLAMSLAPGIGKTLPVETKARLAQGMALLPRTMPQPMQLGRQTIRGAGNRWYSRTPFFPVPDIVSVATPTVTFVEQIVPPTPTLPTIFTETSDSVKLGSDVGDFLATSGIVADQLVILGVPDPVFDPSRTCFIILAALTEAINAFPGIMFSVNPSDLQIATFERMLNTISVLAPLPAPVTYANSPTTYANTNTIYANGSAA